MGRVPRKKVKTLKSVHKKLVNSGSGKKKRKSKTISINTGDQNIPTKHIPINKPNKNLNSTTQNMEIGDDSFSADNFESIETASNVGISDNINYEIIDITDTTIEHENSNTVLSNVIDPCIENDDIIDITESTLVVNENNSSTEFSNVTISPCDDVQFISHTTHVQNNPIEVITLSDDSDEETIPHKQSNEKPTGFISVKGRLGNSAHPTTVLKRKYNSPLHNNKKMSKGGEHDFLPLNQIGAFVVDKQRISYHSQNLDKFKNKITTVLQQHMPSSSTISIAKRKLRPIIIDGLNIGHAHGSGTFSVKGIDICVRYFSDRGHKDIIAFIPQHRQGPPGSESNTLLNILVKKGHICYTPSRKVQNLRMTCYDDRIILNYAHRCGGVVVSNDNYRDLYEESDAFKEIIENRQVMVTFVRDEIIVPDDQYNRKSEIRSLSDILCYPADHY